MTELSHSPTDMPDRRAASRAAARASGRRPLKFHGPPDLILTSKTTSEEQEVPVASSSILMNRRHGRRGFLSPEANVEDYGKEAVKKSYRTGERSRGTVPRHPAHAR